MSGLSNYFPKEDCIEDDKASVSSYSSSSNEDIPFIHNDYSKQQAEERQISDEHIMETLKKGKAERAIDNAIKRRYKGIAVVTKESQDNSIITVYKNYKGIS